MINVINDRNISFRLANSSDFEYVKNLLTEGVEESDCKNDKTEICFL
jgi:hypothetical protein